MATVKSCECWEHPQLWSVGLTRIPRDGTVLGSPGLVPALFPQPFLCPISLWFSLNSSGCFFMPRHSPSLGVHVPPSFPSGSSSASVWEQCWGALLSPLNPDSVHHVAWSKIVVLFFINLFVPQSLIWGKTKKGDGPSCGKQPGSSACSMVLHFPGYLHFWLSMLSFTSSSYTWKVEAMLKSLLGSRAFFFSKNPPKQASWLCLFIWCPGHGTTDPVRQPGRGCSGVKLHN